jgi:hypothetical protein
MQVVQGQSILLMAAGVYEVPYVEQGLLQHFMGL